MVKKLGQRRFLLKSGYTEEELDRMSPSTAHSLIRDMEEANRKRREREKEANMSQSKDFNEIIEEIAEIVYEKLIPEDSVVLSKGEYNKLLLRPLNVAGDLVSYQIKNKKCKYDKDDICVYADNKHLADYCPIQDEVDNARKETAKEFADIVYKALTDKQVWNAKHNWWLQNGECFELKDLLKQILKQQFDVEVEE